MNILDYTKSYKSTSSYVKKATDIVIEHDNYICIYEAENIGNIVFLAISDKHEKSLLENIKYFTNELIEKYNVRIVTIKNKKWNAILNKIKDIVLVYENEEYCIYVREDLYEKWLCD